MISARTAAAWSAVRWSPEQTASIARVMTSFGAIDAPFSRLGQEISKQLFPLRCQHRLGVELDALGGKVAGGGSHDHVSEAGAELEVVGNRARIGHQRVVAAGDERAGQAGEDRPAVVLDLGVLAVDRLPDDDPAAEGLDQRLVAQTDAEDRRPLLGEGAHRLDRYAGLRRCAGAGGDHQAVGAALEQLADLGPVVADDLHLGAELPQVLDEVVGEAVVVVDDESLHRYSQSGCSQASSTARNTAFALLTDSLYS